MKRITKITRRILLFYLLFLYLVGMVTFKVPSYIGADFSYDKEMINNTKEELMFANLIESNKEALDYRLSIISEAKETINMVYYDVGTDLSSQIFFGSLILKANDGVKVNIVLDGTLFNHHKIFTAVNTHPNINIYIFEPRDWIFVYRNNNTVHDKVLSVDGKYGITGGRNINDRFLFNNDVTTDRDVLIYNEKDKIDPVKDMDEYIEYLIDTKYSKPLNRIKENETLTDDLIEKYNKYINDEYYYDLNTIKEASTEIESALFLRSSITRYLKDPVIFKLINEYLIEYDDSIVQSPYITRSRMMKKTFEMNPNTTLITNNPNTNPNMPSQLSYLKIRNELANTYTLYEIQDTFSHHSKTFVFGEELSLVGSLNVDSRSIFLSGESGLLIKSKEFNEELRNKLDEIIDRSLIVDENGKYLEGNVKPVKKKRIKLFFLKIFSYISFLFEEML